MLNFECGKRSDFEGPVTSQTQDADAAVVEATDTTCSCVKHTRAYNKEV